MQKKKTFQEAKSHEAHNSAKRSLLCIQMEDELVLRVNNRCFPPKHLEGDLFKPFRIPKTFAASSFNVNSCEDRLETLVTSSSCQSCN